MHHGDGETGDRPRGSFDGNQGRAYSCSRNESYDGKGDSPVPHERNRMTQWSLNRGG